MVPNKIYKGQDLIRHKSTLHRIKSQPFSSIEHPQNIPANTLELIGTLCRQLRKLRSSRICIYNIKHGVAHLVWPGKFNNCLSFRFFKLKLAIETFNSLEWIIDVRFHGQFELVFLPAQFIRYIFKHLGKFIQNLMGHVSIRSTDFCFSDQPI